MKRYPEGSKAQTVQQSPRSALRSEFTYAFPMTTQPVHTFLKCGPKTQRGSTENPGSAPSCTTKTRQATACTARGRGRAPSTRRNIVWDSAPQGRSGVHRRLRLGRTWTCISSHMIAVQVRMPMGKTFKSLHHCPDPWPAGTAHFSQVPDLILQTTLQCAL